VSIPKCQYSVRIKTFLIGISVSISVSTAL